MNVTAIAASTAAVTARLIEPARTSPAANDPGTLLSRKKASRLNGPQCICTWDVQQNGPGSETAPCRSRAIGASFGHSVLGAPPMRANTRRVWIVLTVWRR